MPPRPRHPDPARWRRRRQGALVLAGAVAAEAASLRFRSGRLGGQVVVHCRDGHLFTTLWIPGVSLKSLRLGPWRFQRCPVGRHWSLVTPVRVEELAAEAQRAASQHHDVPIP